MTIIPESHRDLLQADVGILATVGEDGYPQVTALWFLFDEDGQIKFSLNTARQKVHNLRENPHCTFFVLDITNPYRTLEVRAQAELSPDDEYTFAQRLGGKYRADLRSMDQPGESRLLVTLHPVRVNTHGPAAA